MVGKLNLSKLLKSKKNNIKTVYIESIDADYEYKPLSALQVLDFYEVQDKLGVTQIDGETDPKLIRQFYDVLIDVLISTSPTKVSREELLELNIQLLIEITTAIFNQETADQVAPDVIEHPIGD